MSGDPPRGSLFLSSLYGGHEALRRSIYEACDGRAWVAEHSQPDLATHEPLEVVDTLMRKVREAETFVCVFGSRQGDRDHGAPVPIGAGHSSVSYFEVELYQAALLQKHVHIFVRTDFVPGPRLAALLDILRFAFPPEAWHEPTDDGAIADQVRHLASSSVGARLRGWWCRSSLRRLVEEWYKERGHGIEGLTPFELFDRRPVAPDLSLVKAALSPDPISPHSERRLARTWIALRELMAAPFTESTDPLVLDLWNQALGSWSAGAAWYGLHGHLHLGCLSAISAMAKCRTQLRRHVGEGPHSAHPAGSFGSAYYSTAKLTLRRRSRRWNLERALHHLNMGLDGATTASANLLAIRGSVLMRLGARSAGVADYERVVYLRQSGTDPGPYGQALAELGFGYIMQGHLFKGRRALMDGVRLMESATPDEFLVRAKRKLAIAHAMVARIDLARHEKHEARAIAIQLGAFDQLRQM